MLITKPSPGPLLLPASYRRGPLFGVEIRRDRI